MLGYLYIFRHENKYVNIQLTYMSSGLDYSQLWKESMPQRKSQRLQCCLVEALAT